MVDTRRPIAVDPFSGNGSTRRVAPAPPAPSGARLGHEVITECHPHGWIAWMLLHLARTWSVLEARERQGAFHPGTSATLRPFAAGFAADEPELAEAVHILLAMCDLPEAIQPVEIATACSRLSDWASAHAQPQTSLHFAELAAAADPDSAERAYRAGRENRTVGEWARATAWFRRATRLARIAGDERAFAIAHLGWGTLEHNLGNVAEAEHHFLKGGRAAFRARQRALAGTAHHDLLAVMITTGRFDRAIPHALRAISLYPRGHFRIPHLAFDVGALWLQMGHCSTALYLFEKIVSMFQEPGERLLAHAALARCTAVVHDRVRFERLAERVLEWVAEMPSQTAAALLHLACGAHCFGQHSRAEQLARQATEAAAREGNRSVLLAATALQARLTARAEPEVDHVPPPDSPVDEITQLVLRKFERRNKRRTVPGSVL